MRVNRIVGGLTIVMGLVLTVYPAIGSREVLAQAGTLTKPGNCCIRGMVVPPMPGNACDTDDNGVCQPPGGLCGSGEDICSGVAAGNCWGPYAGVCNFPVATARTVDNYKFNCPQAAGCPCIAVRSGTCGVQNPQCCGGTLCPNSP